MVFGFRPHTPLSLHSLTLHARPSEAALDFSSYMKNIHEEVKQRLSLSTEAYSTATNTRRKDRQFQVGDTVLIYLKPERFSALFSTLKISLNFMARKNQCQQPRI